MSDYNPSPTPFQSEVKLTVDWDTPFVDETLYRQLVGILIFLTHRNPIISFVVCMVSNFMKETHENYSKSVKRILIYL